MSAEANWRLGYGIIISDVVEFVRRCQDQFFLFRFRGSFGNFSANFGQRSLVRETASDKDVERPIKREAERRGRSGERRCI